MDKQDLITKWVKDLRKGGYDNSTDWKYIIREVRKKAQIKVGRKPKKLPVFLTWDEIKVILNTAYNLQKSRNSIKKGLIAETLVKSGVRNAELCNLRVENIDFNTGVGRVVEGKGKKDRYFLIPNSLLQKLKIYLQGRESGYLFLNERANPFSTRSIQYIIQEIRKMDKLKGLVVSFKSNPGFYQQEEDGTKNNTVRKVDTNDDRFKWLKEQRVTHIQIVCSGNAEFNFRREITDVTFWEEFVIITWKHEEEENG